jgi:hypothetical protein
VWGGWKRKAGPGDSDGPSEPAPNPPDPGYGEQLPWPALAAQPGPAPRRQLSLPAHSKGRARLPDVDLAWQWRGCTDPQTCTGASPPTGGADVLSSSHQRGRTWPHAPRRSCINTTWMPAPSRCTEYRQRELREREARGRERSPAWDDTGRTRLRHRHR